MRLKYHLLTLLFATLIGNFLQAQVRNCGAMEYLQFQQQQDPNRALKLIEIERHTNEYLEGNERVDGVITIPVVVHVVWNTSAENISNAQIQSQIDILNEDFRRLNADASNTPSDFQGVAADIEIEFCLATTDPNGNPTNGITRTQTSVTAFSTNDAVKFNSSGGKDAWPASDYLNIWVCDISGGILGYAQFPGGSAATDGVVNDYLYFGDIGTATAPFDLGRTCTHEVGHWLNLRHIWGDGNCNADDFVSDTPRAGGPNYTGAPCSYPGPNSCNEGTGDLPDMFQNYMDYSDDGCMNLFTFGQRTRMRALFDGGGFRASLLSSSGCGTPAPPTCDDGIQNGDETGVDCGGSVCDPCPCLNEAPLTLTITLDNYPEETSWNVTNSGGTVVASGGTYGSQPDGSTVVENITLADGDHTFTILDSYGDGICCAYGVGSYSLVDNTGAVIISGGEFGASESVNFCVTSGPPDVPGCTDQNAHNYDPNATVDDGSCETCTDGILNGDETGVDCGGVLCPTCPVPGCTDPNAHNYDPNATVDDGSCETCTDGILNGDETGVDCGGVLCDPCSNPVPGCTDPNAHNYDPNATVDDGSCETCTDGILNGDETDVDCGGVLCPSCPVPGCTDPNAHNYDPNATVDDGSCETCTDGILNGDETDVDCGGVLCPSCPVPGCTDQNAHNYDPNATVDDGSCETCTDGILNGDETDVDCGGVLCAPCNTGCSDQLINFNNFNSNWGIWNDGGSDCRRSANDAQYASGGTGRPVRLRDNTSTSVMTTDNLNLTAYEELTVNFTYLARSMDNSNEDFWLQISYNGGSSYTTVEEWNRGDEFENLVREFDAVVIAGPFTSNTRLRFRCDASGNSDWVYIDDVEIRGCLGANRLANPAVEEAAPSVEITDLEVITDVKLFPNPTRDQLTINYTLSHTSTVQLVVTDLNGKTMQMQQITADAGKQQAILDVSGLSASMYLVHLITDQGRVTEKFVVID